MQARRAEARDVRRWEGVVAARDNLDQERRYVVWGTGAPPPRLRALAGDGSFADAFAREADTGWAQIPQEERWAVVVPGDEQELDGLVADVPSVRGMTPYLAEGRQDEASVRPMQAPLRDDVAPRRKVDQPRPV